MRNVSSMAKSSAAPGLLTERDKLYLVPVLLPNNNKVAAAAADASAAPVPLCHRPESKSFDKHDQQIRHHQVEIPKSWIPLFPMSPTSTASPSSSSSSTDDSPADRSTAVKTVVIVGRTELLVSVFAQCGCSTNFKSSKGKCYSCQQFLKWSTTSLSRQMLQVRLHSVVVDDDDDNKTTSTASELDDETNDECDGTLSVQYFVSHRGISSKVSYTVNSRGQNEDPDPDGNHIPRVSNARDEGEEQPDPLQWSKNPIRLQRGMFVTIRSYGLEDTYYLSAARQNMEEDHGDNGFRRHRHHRQLDLKVVSLADLQPIRKNSRYNDERADSTIEGDAGLRQRAFKHNYKSNRRDHDSMNNEKTEWKIYFCRYGQDLSLRSVNRLTKFLHQHESIHVVDHYKQATHWIVSGTATVAQIAKTMKLPEDRLRNYVETHPSLVCATPQWPERLLKSSMQSLSGPAIDELWYGIDQNKRRKLSQQQEQQQSNEIFSDRPRACNVQISDFFLQLSKLYEQCETEVEDNIRAWKFHKTAGRLTKIDFEIKPDTPLSKIRNIGGFGSEIANMINQIVLTGQLDRLEEMKQSKRLQAIRDVRAIWGVGKVLSSQLVEKGFTTIEKVRKDLASSTSQLRNLLDWKAKIGVEIYEDLLEDMTRDEVDAIHRIVDTHAQQVFPGCQTRVMGSYRRGKKELGDVDILIVHPKYRKHIPGDVMVQLVDNLARNHHLEFHLTELPGLYHEIISDKDGHVSAQLGHMTPPLDCMSDRGQRCDSHVLRKCDKHAVRTPPQLYGNSTYLSVFRSPTIQGRRRRVDFKLYPYDALPFATLYFTGGKYFNRSMRQFAKSEFNWKLDDKGIKDRRTNKNIDFDPPLKTEHDVFRALGLVYKRPADRKFFDDVEPIDKFNR